ncbi:MAG: diguanylate cyclase [Azospirillaceae bacterium]|nr:diguanylate cyclase [Azospirillaceae bacterium]
MNRDREPLILVVDDEPSNIEILAEVLDDDYDVVFATDGDHALALAETLLPDLILLDVMMPTQDGYDVCARLKQRNDTADIPVIFVTAQADVTAELRGFELGAMDYITKPISPPVLRARVRNHIELKRARDQLTRLATTDGLTGLANRRHFDDTLRTAYHRLVRSNGLLSLVMADVDHFKSFNDTYGHPAGDYGLWSIGHAILGAIERSTDLGARYGGEEFACILPNTDTAGAMVVARKLQQAIAALAIPHKRSPVVPYLTISLGVATVRCTIASTPSTLLTLADQQLYRAKAAGRNCIAGNDQTVTHRSDAVAV